MKTEVAEIYASRHTDWDGRNKEKPNKKAEGQLSPQFVISKLYSSTAFHRNRLKYKNDNSKSENNENI